MSPDPGENPQRTADAINGWREVARRFFPPGHRLYDASGSSGYSSSAFARVETSEGPWLLRLWPPGFEEEALRFVHGHLGRATREALRDGRERRMAVVSLHSSGWSAKAIAGYLKVNRDTVYEVLRRWVREGPDGLEDRRRGRPRGTGKMDLRAMNEVRRLQQNPGLGAFRVRAALEQIVIHLSERI